LQRLTVAERGAPSGSTRRTADTGAGLGGGGFFARTTAAQTMTGRASARPDPGYEMTRSSCIKNVPGSGSLPASIRQFRRSGRRSSPASLTAARLRFAEPSVAGQVLLRGATGRQAARLPGSGTAEDAKQAINGRPLAGRQMSCLAGACSQRFVASVWLAYCDARHCQPAVMDCGMVHAWCHGWVWSKGNF
jgi:hypothetical protein